jgi:phosphatidylserine synthase 1
MSDDDGCITKQEAAELLKAVEEDEFHDDDEHENEENVSAATLKKNDDFRQSMSKSDLDRQHFAYVNERVVNDITLDILYKPHTITILALLCAFLLYKAFSLTEDKTESNIYHGIQATAVLFLVISALVFPNGPFIRPHPMIWRLVFGLSVMYVMLLQFTLFQNFSDVKSALTWIDPELGKDELIEKEYAINCSDVSIERIWSHMDIFAVGHFLGWAMKALLIRHSIICWYISISWELTEVVFAHLLPNFQECWWDALFLDIILCNGLGIFCGLGICKMLEMRTFYWESIKNIRTTRGKFKRAVLQFTPESWIKVDWFNSFAIRRILALYLFIMIWLASELNTFFLKHVFAVDTSHPVVFWRIILIGLISAPTIRQYYVYVTDPKVKRLGMQCWMYCAVTALEAAVCVKFGRNQLPALKLTFICAWIFILAIGTVFCVWLSVWWASYSSQTKGVRIQGGLKRHCYLDSSFENLGTIGEDVRRRRKELKISESDLH